MQQRRAASAESVSVACPRRGYHVAHGAKGMAFGGGRGYQTVPLKAFAAQRSSVLVRTEVLPPKLPQFVLWPCFVVAVTAHTRIHILKLYGLEYSTRSTRARSVQHGQLLQGFHHRQFMQFPAFLAHFSDPDSRTYRRGSDSRTPVLSAGRRCHSEARRPACFPLVPSASSAVIRL